MKRRNIIIPLVALVALASVSCKRLKKPAAAEEREKFIYSLNDSIAAYRQQIESSTEALTALQGEIGELIQDFEHVANPREVEGYYIYKGWKGRYPLKQTGLVARINESEGFEIIATLTGGLFNQISVTASGNSVTSAVVPHDQALNYRAGSLNTVCFYGAAADSIGSFIADNMPEKISVSYLNGKKTGSLLIPADEKEMIAATWQLYSSQKESHRIEKEIPMLSRRIDVCRRMLESADSLKNRE